MLLEHLEVLVDVRILLRALRVLRLRQAVNESLLPPLFQPLNDVVPLGRPAPSIDGKTIVPWQEIRSYAQVLRRSLHILRVRGLQHIRLAVRAVGPGEALTVACDAPLPYPRADGPLAFTPSFDGSFSPGDEGGSRSGAAAIFAAPPELTWSAPSSPPSSSAPSAARLGG